MLYFSKLRITLVSLVTLFFVYIASSNFQNPENSFISKRINLGLDLQGGSYLLLVLPPCFIWFFVTFYVEVFLSGIFISLIFRNVSMAVLNNFFSLFSLILLLF